MASADNGSGELGFLVVIAALFVVPALVFVDEFNNQRAKNGSFSRLKFAENIRKQETWIRPFKPAVRLAKDYAGGTVAVNLANNLLPKDFRWVRPLAAPDETGKRRRLSTYLGEFDWSAAERGSGLPKSSQAVSIWLAHLGRFTYNHEKVRSRDPTWQSVAFTWKNRTGVCRDSATLLTDWLDHHGHDASMALGIVKWGPSNELHAWTVLRIKGVDYILESTGFTQDARMRTPPRASMATDYWPTYQVRPDGDRWHADAFPFLRFTPGRRIYDYQTGWKRTAD